MKIGIEALHINRSYITGIERYLSLVIQALSSLNSASISIVLFARESLGYEDVCKNLQLKPVVTSYEHFENCVEAEGIDVLHCTFIPPKRPLSCGLVYTLHDVGRYIYPGLMAPEITNEHIPRLNKLISEKRCLVLTISEASKADICKTLHLSPQEVHVARLFVTGSLENFAEDTTGDTGILATMGITEPFLLSIGCFSPTKNIGTVLIRQWHISRLALRQSSLGTLTI